MSWKPKGRVAVFLESGPRSLMQWTAKTGVELARAIREGEVTSTAVLDACLARVKRLDKRLNAVVLLYEDSARARAREADAALAAGTLWGPLHGVPLTIKECMLWANTQCCIGVPGAIDGVDDTGTPDRPSNHRPCRTGCTHTLPPSPHVHAILLSRSSVRCCGGAGSRGPRGSRPYLLVGW